MRGNCPRAPRTSRTPSLAPKRRHWGRDGELPVTLLPEDRAVAARFIKWLVPLRGLARFDEIWAIADRAAAGLPFVMADYVPPLAAHQAPMPVGGCANRHSREFHKLFPEARYKDLHLALANRATFTWLSDEEQQAVRKGSPGHDFSPGKPQYLSAERFEVYRKLQAELRAALVTQGVHPGQIEFYMKSFTIDKLDDMGNVTGHRATHNAKAENVLQRKLRQRLTGVRALALVLLPGGFQTLADFAKFFWQHGLQWRESVRLGLAGPINADTGEKLEDDVLIAMPMGGRQCPALCSRCTQALVGRINELGGRSIGHVDEIHQQSSTPGAACIMTMLAAAATSYLGWQLGWAKFELWGHQRVTFLGLTWCSRLMRLQVRWGRRRRTCQTALALFQAYVEKTRVSIKDKASLQGQVISAQAGAREFGLMAVHLKAELRQDLQAHRQQYGAMVQVRKGFACVCRHLVMAGSDKWWNHTRVGAPSRTFAGDASCHAYGIQLLGSPSDDIQNLRDRFTPAELKLPHTDLEQVCTHKGLAGLAEANGYRGRRGKPMVVLGQTDNIAVRAVVNKMHSRSVGLANRQLSFQRRILDPRHLQLRMEWMSGATMVNERTADAQSRVLTKWHEWPLHIDLVWQICHEFLVDKGTLIDMFSEESTARARRFLAYEGDASRAVHRNALSRSLCTRENVDLRLGDTLWAFPPPGLLKEWWSRYEAAASPPDMILVVPAVPSKVRLWSRWLRDAPLLLPPGEEATAPPEASARPTNAPAPVYPPFRWAALLVSKKCGAGLDSVQRTRSSRASTGTAREIRAANTTEPLAASCKYAWMRDTAQTSAR